MTTLSLTPASTDQAPSVGIGSDALVSPSFELRIIDAPAKCLRCGVTTASPTTGKLLNRCHCAGELKTTNDNERNV